MSPRPVALLTDFGHRDPFVGICHGVLLRRDPQIPRIDISHGIARQDVRAGALALADAAPFMPDGCVFIGVVDPGVGSDRRAVALQSADGCCFVGPDNGLLNAAAELRGGVSAAVEISASPWRLDPVSTTFHARDVFAPVAAELACGAELQQGGEPLDPAGLITLPSPRAEFIGGGMVSSVVSVDEFGNIRLAGRLSDFGSVYRGDRLEVVVRERSWTASAAASYAEGENGALLVIEDSTGSLSLAINGGDAAVELGAHVGDPVRLTPR